MRKAICVISVFGLMAILGCSNSQTEKVTISDTILSVDAKETSIKDVKWKFEETGVGEYDEPLTRISLEVNGKVFLVAEKILGGAYELTKEQWPDYKIPEKAMLVCMAWWAGSGDVFYGIKEGENLQVFHGFIGEGIDMEKDLKYEKVKEITASEF